MGLVCYFKKLTVYPYPTNNALYSLPFERLASSNSNSLMKTSFTFLFAFIVAISFSQSIVTWSPTYQLTLADFQSPESEINPALTSYSIYPGARIDFHFQMSSIEFMFTKNLNSKAKATFNKNAAVIIAPDSTLANQLVAIGQYSFDLTELYTRKFRKALFEQKNAFSKSNFYQTLFTQLHDEMNAESARVSKITELGKNEALLSIEHQQVLAAITLLSDYCMTCTPPKKKKRK